MLQDHDVQEKFEEAGPRELDISAFLDIGVHTLLEDQQNTVRYGLLADHFHLKVCFTLLLGPLSELICPQLTPS